MTALRLSPTLLASTAAAVICMATSASAATPTCSELGTNPAWGLAGNSMISNLTAVDVAASGGNAAYCRVEFVYTGPGQVGPAAQYPAGQQETIGIRIGLPEKAAWNGRTRNIGGGGCQGSLSSVTVATNAGYVGSNTDTGHFGDGCNFAVDQTTKTVNYGKLRDFIYESLFNQVRWTKVIAKTYYGTEATRNYWDGCSTGGRQGLALAQKHADLLDGWLIGAPAVNYSRFRGSSMWGQVLMNNLLGGVIPAAKLNQATASAVAACDAADGVVDGIIDDPRTCTWSAANNICGAPGAPATNCLTATEASIVDKMWDGPRNAKGKKIYFGWDRGAPLTVWGGASPFGTGIANFQWAHGDLTFDWKTVTLANFPAEMQLASNVLGDATITADTTLDDFPNSGKKILGWVGVADGNIPTSGGIDYYRRVANYFGGYDNIKSWFRYFRAPGVAHCGGGTGPQPVDLFERMVQWVETGVAPDTILAQGGAVANRTRPLCPYPTTAIYNGTGSTDDAANFHCGGNLETPAILSQDMLAKYKFETQ